MTQHVRALRKPHPPSDPGPLRFRWRRFHKIAHLLPPLFQQHWEEIALDQGTVPLEPDWDSYHALDLNQVLHVLSAWDLDGQLVGYIFNLIGGHQHYVGTRFAHTEMFWLHPDYRKGWLPVRMFLANIEGLRARGAVVSTINFKLRFKYGRVGRLLARLGYTATDIVMRKVL